MKTARKSLSADTEYVVVIEGDVSDIYLSFEANVTYTLCDAAGNVETGASENTFVASSPSGIILTVPQELMNPNFTFYVAVDTESFINILVNGVDPTISITATP